MSAALEPDPSTLRARCPRCGEELWGQRAGEWTLRSAVVKLVDGRLMARCPERGCGGLVPLPWLALQPSPPTEPRQRIRVRRLVPLDGGRSTG